jgi:hypothetical protein
MRWDCFDLNLQHVLDLSLQGDDNVSGMTSTPSSLVSVFYRNHNHVNNKNGFVVV